MAFWGSDICANMVAASYTKAWLNVGSSGPSVSEANMKPILGVFWLAVQTLARSLANLGFSNVVPFVRTMPCPLRGMKPGVSYRRLLFRVYVL